MRAHAGLRVTWPLLAVAAVAAVDLLDHRASLAVPVWGLLDECAHLLTAGLFLAAAGRPLSRFAAWTMLGACVIDVDHVPLYLGHMAITVEGGRPVTHSLLTVVVLMCSAAVVRGRPRSALAGLGTGVLLHFVRDVATGPGLPLLWPVLPDNVRIAYHWYFGVLLVAAAVSVVRASVRRTARAGAAGSPASPYPRQRRS
jgi:inner membrane protein